MKQCTTRRAVYIALAMLLLGAMAVGPAAAQPPDEDGALLNGVPRVGTPTAHLQPKESASAFYTYRGASHEGRDLGSHQYGVVVGVTSDIELAWDRHELHVDGRNAGNDFDAWATGLQARYAEDNLLGGEGAYVVQYRRGRGQVIQGGALRRPPRSHTWTFGAVTSRPFHGDSEVHIRTSASYCDVGNQDAWTLLAGAGIDHPLTSSLTAQGDLTLFREVGDIDNTEVAVSGGLRYNCKRGFFADVNGTWLPAGTPLAGNPLGDGSIFALDPVFANDPIVRDFRDDSLGFYSVRVGYTTDF